MNIMESYILEMNNIKKNFGRVQALKRVDLKIKRGTIHSICGENGAGKSTLMNVLSGVIPAGEYEGDIIYNGQKQSFKNIKDSESEGIVIIHQELALVPLMSIAENIFLGNEITNKYGAIDFDTIHKISKELLKAVNLADEPETLVGELGVGKQQLVEIAKAISKKVDLLILDEPTASLNEDDSENLLALMKEFRRQGITCIIISHKLNEVMEVSDSITIIRDGETVNTWDVVKDNVTEDMIIQGMVGRELTDRYPERESVVGEKLFEVKNWSADHPFISERKILDDINFHINKGEVVGIAGLMGAGRTELAMSLFGRSYGRNISGKILINNEEVDLQNVNDAIQAGLAYVTEDRKGNGLNQIQNIHENIAMASFSKFAQGLVINEDKELANSLHYHESLRIKSPDVYQTVGNLSGGNQQKVVIAKWLTTEPDILFLDEPTRGIDVGAKYEIYQIINEMVAEGKAVCIISSELPELLGMCDRIYTMSAGKFTNCIDIQDADQEVLMEYMTKEVG